MTRDEALARIAHEGDRGFLLRNEKKDFRSADERERRKPDYTGRIHCGGVLYFMSAWVSTAKSGRTFLSVRTELAGGQDLALGALLREGEAEAAAGSRESDDVGAEDTGLPF